MSTTAPALNAFKKIVDQVPEAHFYPGDRVRVLRSQQTALLGREYEVLEGHENGTLICHSYEGARAFMLYTYQVHLVHRPLLNNVRALFAALAV